MTEQLARLCEVRIANALVFVAGTSTFERVGAVERGSISFDDPTTPVTTTTSAGGWQKLLALGGIPRITIDGTITLTDDAAAARLRRAFRAASFYRYEIFIPGEGTWVCEFQLMNLTFQFQTEGALTYSWRMESSGAPAFTPAP